LAAHRRAEAPRVSGKLVQDLLKRADREILPLHLNFYQRARLANSFKWRLLDRGFEQRLADELTEALVLHFAMKRDCSPPASGPPAPPSRLEPRKAQRLLAQADACLARSEFEEAVGLYRDALELDPRRTASLNGMGTALFKLGHYTEAAEAWRHAIRLTPADPAAHYHLGGLLSLQGRLTEAEASLRRALHLKPLYPDAQSILAATLVLRGSLRAAEALFEKVLRVESRHLRSLLGMGRIAEIEGRFAEAEAKYQRVLELNPNDANALSGLMNLRKMTSDDERLLKRAEEVAALKGIAPVDEATARFAIGKYYDDVGDYKPAFRSYRRANELMKPLAAPYDRDGHRKLVDDLIRVYTREGVANAIARGSDSSMPVLVVGMPRSGTSLTEQILASHPLVSGAGELAFWNSAFGDHENALRQQPPSETVRRKLAAAYLAALATPSDGAKRVLDKMPTNADHLGIVHSVFPRARFIYMQRNPIDSCLSCYFQRFSAGLHFTFDLSDLAHYYREHHRLMEHWRKVLPPGTLLEVPYEELVADQERWSRRMIEFLGLEWDPRCLQFQDTQRPVATASFWQVRQKVYTGSRERWRHYERFIGPLLDLKTLV
jgi:tetratricopeptide (TPR) repeat protein